MEIAQILVAAGKGARFGGDTPKQYRKIHGKPVLSYTIDAMLKHSAISQTIIVVAAEDEYIQKIVATTTPSPIVVRGGATRTASVFAGLKALEDSTPEFVLIHDGARPFVTVDTIDALISALGNADAAVPTLPIVNAVKFFENGIIGDDLDRAEIRQVQTPQAFRYPKIWNAFKAFAQNEDFADDIAVARKAGLDIATIEGDPRNFKITHPEDLIKAHNQLSQKTYMATGQGYDVHRTEPGDSVWLCGIEIAADFSLKGHSDADVGLHAITDAILGALAEGDIGDHFPPSDPQWKGASSDQFLKFAQEQVQKRAGQIKHADITLICEQPKIKPHRQAMRQRISEILELDVRRVSVKATTTEKLGYTGRGEGIAAQAIVSVELPDE